DMIQREALAANVKRAFAEKRGSGCVRIGLKQLAASLPDEAGSVSFFGLKIGILLASRLRIEFLDADFDGWIDADIVPSGEMAKAIGIGECIWSLFDQFAVAVSEDDAGIEAFRI